MAPTSGPGGWQGLGSLDELAGQGDAHADQQGADGLLALALGLADENTRARVKTVVAPFRLGASVYSCSLVTCIGLCRLLVKPFGQFSQIRK